MNLIKEFFYLEGAYLILAVIILAITAFVTTRPFMSKNALKKGLIYVSSFLAIAIFAHFSLTKSRMNSVKKAFSEGKTIMCENRIYTKGANFVEIRNNGLWKLENDNFYNPHYVRVFFTARCFVK